MRTFAIISAAAGALLLAGCGSTTEDRALSGGALGAGVGAAVGAVTGLTMVEGALIGAAGGALAGALTDETQLNLGAPVWRSESAGPATRSELVRNIQGELNARGYDAGPADGVTGPRTRAAIRRYQQANGLPVDGAATPELWRRLQRQASRP